MVEQPIQLLTGQGQVVDGVICTMEQRPLRYSEMRTRRKWWMESSAPWSSAIWRTLRPSGREFWKPLGSLIANWMWDYKLRQSRQESRYEAYALEVEAPYAGAHVPGNSVASFSGAVGGSSGVCGSSGLSFPGTGCYVGNTLTFFSRSGDKLSCSLLGSRRSRSGLWRSGRASISARNSEMFNAEQSSRVARVMGNDSREKRRLGR